VAVWKKMDSQSNLDKIATRIKEGLEGVPKNLLKNYVEEFS